MRIKAKIDKGNCRSCGREIRWVRFHPSLKAHPMNPGIPISITIYEDGEELYEVDVTKHSHFNTCPNADKHRTKPKPKLEKFVPGQKELF